MAGPGRGADGSDGAVSSVSERSLFAASVPVIPAPDSLPRLDVRPLPPEGPATVPSPKIGLAVRLRGHLRHLSPSGIRNNLASAAGMEIDRGVAFLLVPVFLACGVIFYFSLAREPDFSQPIAVVVLTALCAAGSRSWRKTHLCSWLRCCARSACSPPRLRLARGNADGRRGNPDAAGRPDRQPRPDGERSHPADHRCDLGRPASAALYAQADSRFGHENTAGRGRRIESDRLCQTAATNRPGAAGRL